MTESELGTMSLQNSKILYRGLEYYISSLQGDTDGNCYLFLSKKKYEYESRFCIKADYRDCKIVKDVE